MFGLCPWTRSLSLLLLVLLLLLVWLVVQLILAQQCIECEGVCFLDLLSAAAWCLRCAHVHTEFKSVAKQSTLGARAFASSVFCLLLLVGVCVVHTISDTHLRWLQI